MPEPVRLSILDLAPVAAGQTPADGFAASVAVAQAAERAGYTRIWYAEHHNMATIASSAPGILIAHVAAQTSTIRLGSGGVMLPNHSPLVIAEQFGTLATLHPGRIDLGLGRAPGTDGRTVQALRPVDPTAERFPTDVEDLRGYFADESRVPGVYAVPGRGTRVPLYILGSSLFGANLAAKLGLPYAFASQFAPDSLHEAVALYRRAFTPSEQLAEPYVIAGMSVVAADTQEAADVQWRATRRARVRNFLPKTETIDDAQADALLASLQGRRVDAMLRYSAIGTPPEVAKGVQEFAAHADGDEVMLLHQAPDREARLRSVELLGAEMLGAG